MTILQLVPALDVGGAERATVDIAAALAGAGHRALVMSSGGALVRELDCCGAEHFECEIGKKNPWRVWTNGRRLVDFIRSEQVNLVHARSRIPAWSAYLATRKTRVPLVTTFHNAYSRKNAAKKFYNSVMARGDRVIAISPFVADHIVANYRIPIERIAIIPRGIDFSVYDPSAITAERKQKFRAVHKLQTNIPLIIIPARLSPSKCHELALRTFATLSDLPFQCLVIGPDQGRPGYRAHLVALARKLNLQDKVDFVESADLPAAYATADVVLSLSRKVEGFGRVAAEAQAMGVPVIATAIGALSQTVLNGETGWLVPAGNASALADAIVRALSLGPEHRRAMAKRAMCHVREHFDIEQMCGSTLEVYAELLRARS